VSAICLWWVGEEDPDDAALEHARAHLETVFACEIRLERRDGVPAEAFDARRRQTSSTKVVQWLASQRPLDAERVLGVLGADLFIPVLTFVFGEAQLGGTAAVVSTARLGLPEAGESGRHLLCARLAKECVHELGHTYGLTHCGDQRCAMSRSASVIDVDTKTAELCADCRIRLADHRRGLRK
jgi:archaemetzincin